MTDRLVWSLSATDRGVWSTSASDMIVWEIFTSPGFAATYSFTVIVSPNVACCVKA